MYLIDSSTNKLELFLATELRPMDTVEPLHSLHGRAISFQACFCTDSLRTQGQIQYKLLVTSLDDMHRHWDVALIHQVRPETFDGPLLRTVPC